MKDIIKHIHIYLFRLIFKKSSLYSVRVIKVGYGYELCYRMSDVYLVNKLETWFATDRSIDNVKSTFCSTIVYSILTEDQFLYKLSRVIPYYTIYRGYDKETYN